MNVDSSIKQLISFLRDVSKEKEKAWAEKNYEVYISLCEDDKLLVCEMMKAFGDKEIDWAEIYGN